MNRCREEMVYNKQEIQSIIKKTQTNITNATLHLNKTLYYRGCNVFINDYRNKNNKIFSDAIHAQIKISRNTFE